MFARNGLMRRSTNVIALATFGALLGGCDGGTSLTAPDSGDAASQDLMRPIAMEQNTKTALIASAKLRAADGVKMSGELSIHDQGDEIVIVATAMDMNPSMQYVSFLHERSPLTSATCDTAGNSVALGRWSVAADGYGHLKIVLKRETVQPFQKFGSVSVQRVPSIQQDAAGVEACGALVFF